MALTPTISIEEKLDRERGGGDVEAVSMSLRVVRLVVVSERERLLCSHVAEGVVVSLGMNSGCGGGVSGVSVLWVGHQEIQSSVIRCGSGQES